MQKCSIGKSANKKKTPTTTKSLFSLNHNRTKARLFCTVDGSIMNLYFCYDKKYNVANLWRFRTQYTLHNMHSRQAHTQQLRRRWRRYRQWRRWRRCASTILNGLMAWTESIRYLSSLFSHTTCGISFQRLRIGASDIRIIYRERYTFGFVWIDSSRGEYSPCFFSGRGSA